ncbi:MAG: alpha-1,4-glucan--maltose-1-phosphate maltosyltransferase, partial [Ignavibacteria bacterium]|nr:alpha-1,4-glucan--maltose-1-phosphate maltosyltransferase [Ignavibacteria bacterium]
KEEYFNSEKYEVYKWDWETKNKITEVITLVNKARRNNKALQSTNNIQFCELQNENLLAYFKATDDGDNCLLMIVNLDPYHKQNGWIQVPINKFNITDGQNYVMHDLITDARFTWNREWNFVELDPNGLPFHLLKVEKA